MGTEGIEIFIAGYYGFRNTGDEAILSGILSGVGPAPSRARVTVASGDPALTEHIHGVAAVPWQDLPAMEAAIRTADVVIIGGGGLFHDHWPFEPTDMLTRFHGGISYLGTVAWLASLHQRPLVIRSVGVGPLLTRMGQDHTRAVFEQAWASSVRDEESLELLATLGLDTSRIQVSADPAYLLRPPSREEILRILETRGIESARPRLGVALRDWPLPAPGDTWLEGVAEVLDRWAREHDGDVLLIPFQHLPGEATDDLEISRRLATHLDPGTPVTVLEPGLSLPDLIAVLGSCRSVLAMRLHAVILSALAGTPPLAIAYDPKVERAMATLGIPQLSLDLAGATATALHRLLETLDEDRPNLLATLEAGVAAQARAARRDTELLHRVLAGELGPPPPPSEATARLQRKAVLGLALRADTTYGNNEAMVAERHDLVTERDRLAGQVNLLSTQCDGLRNALNTREAELARALERTAVLEGAKAGLEARLENARAELETARAELVAARERIASLEQENARLAWKARGVLGRAADRLFGPRHGGHLRHWARTLYYAVAGVILGLSGRRRSGEGAGAPSPLYAARFERYLEARRAACGSPGEGMLCPSEAGLVSIVLPVYNGGPLLEEALDSILEQTYTRWELIAVDDGSTDGSGEVLDRYAARDSRIRVVHQENQKLPRTLSNGFRLARGQYLTWTSHDNRLKPDFLKRMVDCLERHPDWDMAYANMDIIGDDGMPLMGSGWYLGYQRPRGSQHIHLPAVRGELNTWPNNYVGAAFLYRDRVKALLGDYGADRFTVEDYDHWMLVNEFLELHHVDFEETVYEYRFHENSLTTQEDDDRMLQLREKVMVFDDFRRDFALSAMTWILDDFPVDGPGGEVRAEIRRRIQEAGHLEMAPEACDPDSLPDLWFPTAYIRWSPEPGNAPPPPKNLPRHALRVLLTASEGELPPDLQQGWDLVATVASTPALVRTNVPDQGWYAFSDIASLFAATDIRTRLKQFRAIEEAIRRDGEEEFDATVVISTFRRRKELEQLLVSLAAQTVEPERFEILVVNNDPDDDLGSLVDRIRKTLFSDRPDRLRLLVCPLRGLSHARNAGIGAARGRIVAFIDDDAVAAPDWLRRLLQAYESDPELGVVGGAILLALPDPAPPWLTEEAWPLWGYLNPSSRELHRAVSWSDYPWGGNWSARRHLLLEIGGFRYGYGRKGDDYGGGEEIVAASLAGRLGAGIALEPEAVIEHRPGASRFTPEYVRKTIRAGTFVTYFLQRDLYVPVFETAVDVLERIFRRALRVATFRDRSPYRRMEQRARLAADFAVFRLMASDARYRARMRS